MARKTLLDWFHAGSAILAEQGAQALTIDRLAVAIAVTKGSFYHHFTDIAEYKTAFLGYIEAADSTDVIAQLEHSAPLDQLKRLFDIAATYPQDLALAMQAWALQDAEVRAVQARTYARQLAYTSALFEALIPDKARARLAAQMAFCILIGSLHVQSQLPKNARRRFFDEIIRIYIP
jgi:AcrR family transcriptional regulator